MVSMHSLVSSILSMVQAMIIIELDTYTKNNITIMCLELGCLGINGRTKIPSFCTRDNQYLYVRIYVRCRYIFMILNVSSAA